ncbi:hypothetical protein [Streptomyces sp. NPDC059753]|uniref:hypothetical protein n=1 Tax=Streptomyces sp. NPDC059753 TaxID=3346933 RepID=UPI00365656F1
MADETEEPTGEPEPGGEMVPPVVAYEPEYVEPAPADVPSTPESTDGSSIVDGPTYPAPGEVDG